MKLDDTKLYVSLFLIPDDYRVKLAELAEGLKIKGIKSSINTLILEALRGYLESSAEDKTAPKLPSTPTRTFTVRMPKSIKSQLAVTAATWQLKTALPVSMNAVVNTAIALYLKQHTKDF